MSETTKNGTLFVSEQSFPEEINNSLFHFLLEGKQNLESMKSLNGKKIHFDVTLKQKIL